MCLLKAVIAFGQTADFERPVVGSGRPLLHFRQARRGVVGIRAEVVGIARCNRYGRLLAVGEAVRKPVQLEERSQVSRGVSAPIVIGYGQRDRAASRCGCIVARSICGNRLERCTAARKNQGECNEEGKGVAYDGLAHANLPCVP